MTRRPSQAIAWARRAIDRAKPHARRAAERARALARVLAATLARELAPSRLAERARAIGWRRALRFVRRAIATGLAGALLFAIVMARVHGCPGPEGKGVDSPPGPFSIWIQRNAQSVIAKIMRQQRFDFLWGPICRFTVATERGWLVGIGFSIVELVPGSDGRLEEARSVRIGASTHGGIVRGARAYVTAGWDGIATLDLSRPDAMRVVSREGGLGYALWIAAARDHLLIAMKERGGIAVYGLADPDHPTLAVHLLNGESYAQVVVDGDRAYAVGSEKLVVLDVSDPARTHVLGTLPMPYEAEIRPTDPMPRHVAVHGPHVYLSHGAKGLYVADASDPAAPKLVAHWDGIEFCDWVQVEGDRLYAAAEGSPVEVADLADPLQPRHVGTLDTGALGRPLAAGASPTSGALLALALGPRGVFVYDAAGAAVPTLVAKMRPQPWFHRVRVMDGQAYATAGSGGLHVYDLADAAAPREIGVLDTQGLARGLLVVDDELWISDVLGWLLLTRPVRGGLPELVAVADRGGHAWDAAVVGDRAYLANSQVGLGVLERRGDVLTMIGETSARGYTLEVEGHGPFAYIGTVSDGVVVFDTSTLPPKRLTSLRWETLGPFQLAPAATAVTVLGDTMYVGDPQGRLLAFDLSRPEDPPLRWVERVGGSIFEITPVPEGLLVAAGPNGVALVHPEADGVRVLGRWDVPGTAMSTARVADRILVAAGPAGLVSLPATPP